MSLPIAWIDRIFDRLTVRYGNRFLDRWKGVNMDAVRYDWSSTLAGLKGWPEAIAFAFGLIDDEKPPTAAMFRSLALKAPKPERLALPEPAADPDRIAAEIAKLEHLRTKPAADSGHGMKAWAYRLKARDEAGESINMNQRRCYQAALGMSA
jgi:hypothetical protein